MSIKATVLILLAALWGCTEPSPGLTPTSGVLVVGVDESLKPGLEAGFESFMAWYPKARITPLYLPEREVVAKLLANEIQTGFICRELSVEETAQLKARFGHTAVAVKLAEDAIVPIISAENPVRHFPDGYVTKILSGEITRWDQVDPSGRSAPIVAVMTTDSSVVRALSSGWRKNFGVGTTPEVIAYIKSNPSALGLVGGSWIYGKGLRGDGIKILGGRDGEAGVTANPEFKREVFGITHEPAMGLGNGVITFMASEKGQLILSKAGMTPDRPIVREIRLRETSSE